MAWGLDLRGWASVRLVESGSTMPLLSHLYERMGTPIKPLFHIKTNNSLFPEGICLVTEQ